MSAPPVTHNIPSFQAPIICGFLSDPIEISIAPRAGSAWGLLQLVPRRLGSGIQPALVSPASCP